MTRSGTILVGTAKMAAAAVAIVALVVGVPYLLVTYIGNPLPTVVPAWDDVRYAVTNGQIDDWTWVKLFACIVWVGWTHLMASFVVEVAAAARGVASGAVRGLGASQWMARRLVAQFTLISTLLVQTASSPAAALPPLPSFEPAVSEVIDLVGPALDLPQAPAEVGGASVEVKRRETLWDLAALHLGEGERWPEIRDANVGRSMPDGTVLDDSFLNIRPGWELVIPGLAEPSAAPGGANLASAAGGASRAGGPASDVDAGVDSTTGADIIGTWRVEPGDHFWRIAEETLTGSLGRTPTEAEVRSYWVDLVEANREHLTSSDADPDLIYAEQQFEVLMPPLPESAGETPTGAEAAAADRLDAIEQFTPLVPTPPQMPTAATGGAEQSASSRSADDESVIIRKPKPVEPSAAAASADADRSSDDDRPGSGKSDSVGVVLDAPGGESLPPGPDHDQGVGALAIGSGALLVATGLLGSLRRSRRLRLAQVGEGLVPEAPPVDLVDVETVLRNRADGVSARSLLNAVASIGHDVDRPDDPASVPEVIRVTSERMEAVVRGGETPPDGSPWQPAEPVGPGGHLDTGQRILVAPLDRVAGIGQSPSPSLPAPTLVTIGSGLLINLEAIGVVAIDGPVEQVAGVTRSLVHELTTTVDGVDHGDPVELWISDRVPAVEPNGAIRSEPIERIVDHVTNRLGDIELQLLASSASSPWALRSSRSGAGGVRAIVVVADGADDVDGRALGPLIDRAKARRLPLAVILTGDRSASSIEPTMTAELSDGTVELRPLGIKAPLDVLDLELVLGVEALIDHARRAPIVVRPPIDWPEADIQEPAGGALESPAGASAVDPGQVSTEETPEHEIVTELPDEEEELTDRSDEQESGLLIRILGPVEIEGVDAELSDEQRSVLTFLALAGPSTTTQIGDAVWPGGIDEEHREAVLDGLRRALGELFVRTGDDRYRVRSTITDLGSARRWIGQSAALSGDRARNILQVAVSDVRGRPFTGVSTRHWQWIEDHRMAVATQASSLLMDACFDLCDRAYEADDIHLALWACEVAGRLDPLQETVIVRQVQLLSLLGRGHEAAEIVDRWEADFASDAGRPAPRGPRRALEEQRDDEAGRRGDLVGAEGTVPHVG